MMSHDIDVGIYVPIKQHLYSINPSKREIMKTEVDYLLQNGLAIPSQSPWSSPSLLVSKPDSTFHFCTDYRKVNNVTKPDSFSLPPNGRLHGQGWCFEVVTKLDLLKGYWQVPLTAHKCEISAFVTPWQLPPVQLYGFWDAKCPRNISKAHAGKNIQDCATVKLIWMTLWGLFRALGEPHR